MAIYVALLRGINVGGHNKIKMADLRQLLGTMGLTNVKTYIQSGNVIFESEKDKNELSQSIENKIKNVLGLSVPVIIRTANEMKHIIKNCPFPVDELLEGETIHVALLSDLPSQEKITYLHNFETEVDEFQIKDKEVYLLFHQSIRKSKLPVRLSKLGVSTTLRNWKTMNKLAEMVKSME